MVKGRKEVQTFKQCDGHLSTVTDRPSLPGPPTPCHAFRGWLCNGLLSGSFPPDFTQLRCISSTQQFFVKHFWKKYVTQINMMYNTYPWNAKMSLCVYNRNVFRQSNSYIIYWALNYNLGTLRDANIIQHKSCLQGS